MRNDVSRITVSQVDNFRDGDRVVQDRIDFSKGVQKKTAEKLGKVHDTGLITDRTAADILAKPGENPYAVEQIGIAVMLTFRRKAMGLVIAQSIVVNLIAIIIDRFVPLPSAHWGYFMGTWLVPLGLLAALNYWRYKVPVNYVLLVAFTITIGLTFGLLRAPMEHFTSKYVDANMKLHSPQCYGLAGHTIALLLLSVLTCFSCRQKVLRMSVVAIAVAIVTDAAGIVAYMFHWNDIGPTFFIVVAIICNTMSLMWIGFQMDRMTTRLMVDEYLQPVILLWSEVFVMLLTCLLLCAACAAMLIGDGGGDEAGCCAGGCSSGDTGCMYFWYCDCYIDYGNTSRVSPGEQTERPPDEEAPPSQESLPEHPGEAAT